MIMLGKDGERDKIMLKLAAMDIFLESIRRSRQNQRFILHCWY